MGDYWLVRPEIPKPSRASRASRASPPGFGITVHASNRLLIHLRMRQSYSVISHRRRYANIIGCPRLVFPKTGLEWCARLM